MQARLEAEQREAERRREEVLEAELQAQQAAAALTDRLRSAERDGAAAAAELQVCCSIVSSQSLNHCGSAAFHSSHPQKRHVMHSGRSVRDHRFCR